MHEFCKLFGKHGTPEYGCGGVTFPDFLALKSSDSGDEASAYYQSCVNVTLERQVGNRYFVSAANASRILFLREAAIDFLRFSGRYNGNRLERDVYRKLQDPDEVSQLKADGLMFQHVYADIVMLAKSNELNKSTLDMNQHYLELKLFLQEVEHFPEVVMDKNLKVFRSEERLYGDKNVVNHRLHLKSQAVQNRLFSPDEWDNSLLHPLLTVGAAAMRETLCSYARNQLPGGIYWDPEPQITDGKQHRTLSQLGAWNIGASYNIALL